MMIVWLGFTVFMAFEKSSWRVSKIESALNYFFIRMAGYSF